MARDIFAAILLIGLDTSDETRHWFDGLGDELKKFTASGGWLLLDSESVVPQGLSAARTEMAVRAYITQGEGGTDNPSTDQTQALFERNRDNIARLQAAMKGIAAPLAASTEPTIWAIPHQTGDVQHISAINMGYEPGKSATQLVKPQSGALKWSTTRPIYDVRAARKLSPGEASRADLTRDAFQLYALPPAPITTPQVLAARGADGFYSATVSIGAPAMRGVPYKCL